MRIYWWPFFHEEYFWSVSTIVVAKSLENAKKILMERLEKELLSTECYVKHGSDIIVRQLFIKALENMPQVIDITEPEEEAYWSETSR